jgi:quinol monooxygenase YgiN
MKLLFRCLLGVALLAPHFMQSARADDANTAYIVAYFEVVPPASGKALGLLRTLAKASRKDEGNLRFEVMQRRGQRNHFAVLEAWKDKDAQAAHAAAAHTQQFREKLQPLLRSPYDERPHAGMSVDSRPATPEAKGAEIYVVTHVDIVPTEKEKGIGFVKDLTEASRSDEGSVRFDLLQQISRPNHLTVVEIWRNQKAVDTHGMAAHTKQFREKLTPLSGSLYDERLYKVFN